MPGPMTRAGMAGRPENRMQYQLLPDLSEEEYAGLKASIAARGVMVPVELDEDGNVLDGYNRVRAWGELRAEGIDVPDYPTVTRAGMDDHQKTIHILALNLARRHLTAEQRAELHVRLRQRGMSYRTIAEQTKVDVSTVHADVQKAGVGNPTPAQPPRVAGADGKSYPAAQPRRAPEPTLPAPPETPDPEALTAEPAAAELIVEAEPEAQPTLAPGEDAPECGAEPVYEYYKRGADTPRTAEEEVRQPFDHCQTPGYAIDPLLPYLPGNSVVWEPARGEGLLVAAFYDASRQVVSSDITTGENFFEYQPERWDVLVTNPPYSLKFRWLERCYSLGKPFALLLPVETLGAKAAQVLFALHGVQVMFLDRRINFKMPRKGWEGSSPFPVAWFTWRLDLPSQMVFEKVVPDANDEL